LAKLFWQNIHDSNHSKISNNVLALTTLGDVTQIETCVTTPKVTNEGTVLVAVADGFTKR
jgi:hypothetical protein